MQAELLNRAREIHRLYPVIDAHCDTILCLANGGRLGGQGSPGQVDLRRLKAAGVKLVFFAVFVERVYLPGNGLRRTLQLLDCFWREFDENRQALQVVERRQDLTELLASDRVGVLLTLEGGEALERDLGILRQLNRLGIWGMGLTWNDRNDLAGGVGEHQAPGLSDFGLAVVQEMNRLGMVVDVAHLSERAFWQVLETSSAPVVASHANAWGVCPHPRNLKDAQLQALARRGGVVGVTFVPGFVDPVAPSVVRVADHVEYLCSTIGVDAVGLGSDFDGSEEQVPGLEDAAALPNLTANLLARGFTEDQLQKILGGNWLRLLEGILP